ITLELAACAAGAKNIPIPSTIVKARRNAIILLFNLVLFFICTSEFYIFAPPLISKFYSSRPGPFGKYGYWYQVQVLKGLYGRSIRYLRG
ncbi:MAG TPA: hypothetical protein DER33_00145, partial [Syntrophomonas sp.]|nr:hypothetical protein [Syntrophomonas sp.]